jgi:ribokinase
MSVNQRANKIVLVGDLNVDIFLQIAEYPQLGGDGMARQLVMQTGGSVTNTAVALAHLGDEPFLFSHAGNDIWANLVLDTLKREGVVTDYTIRDGADSTGVTFLAVTPDGERTMFTYRGANALLAPAEITRESFTGAKMLHLSGYAFLSPPQSEAAWRAVELATGMGIGITLDMGVDPAYKMGQSLIDLLPRLNLIILGEPEACAIVKTQNVAEAVNYLSRRGVEVVGLKLGKHGCQLTMQDHQVMIPGLPVKVVDTTGAGDAFCAGMIHGMASGLSLPAAGILANAMGALATTTWGAGAALPKLGQVIEFLSVPENQTEQTAAWIAEVLDHFHSR